MQTREELEATFRRLGIDFAKPGFCDTTEFQAVERADPTVLNLYAQYIQRLKLSEGYLVHARTVIQDTAEFLYRELVADGRRGARIDISGVLLRFLERQGIWCHVVGGGLKVEFPPTSGIRPRWFYPLIHENNNAFTGHAWVFAWPFRIVDLSVSLQPYPREQEPFFNGYSLAEECDEARKPGIRSLMEPELIDEFLRSRRRMPTMDDLPSNLHEFMKAFPSHQLVKGGIRFTYTPVKISAPDLPLELMRVPALSGRLPIQVFEGFQRAN